MTAATALHSVSDKKKPPPVSFFKQLRETVVDFDIFLLHT